MQNRSHPVRICSLAAVLLFTLSAPVLARAEEAKPEAKVDAKTEAASTPAAPAVENSVVKVFSTMRYPDPFKPWTKQAPHEVSGTGVVIEGKRILTARHAPESVRNP